MAYGKAGDWYVNNVEGGGGSSDFVICVDSRSATSLAIFTHDITEGDTPPDVEITKGSGHLFSNPVYFIDSGYHNTLQYGSITEMGHILDNPEYPIYYKVEGDLFIKLTSN